MRSAEGQLYRTDESAVQSLHNVDTTYILLSPPCIGCWGQWYTCYPLDTC